MTGNGVHAQATGSPGRVGIVEVTSPAPGDPAADLMCQVPRSHDHEIRQGQRKPVKIFETRSGMNSRDCQTSPACSAPGRQTLGRQAPTPGDPSSEPAVTVGAGEIGKPGIVRTGFPGPLT